MRFAQFAIQALCHIERGDFLRASVATVGPVILPPCPASTTTVVKVLLVSSFGAVGTVVQAANEARRLRPRARQISRGIRLITLKRLFFQKFLSGNVKTFSSGPRCFAARFRKKRLFLFARN